MSIWFVILFLEPLTCNDLNKCLLHGKFVDLPINEDQLFVECVHYLLSFTFSFLCQMIVTFCFSFNLLLTVVVYLYTLFHRCLTYSILSKLSSVINSATYGWNTRIKCDCIILWTLAQLFRTHSQWSEWLSS